MKQLRLTIELIPQTSWFNNLRSLLPYSSWQLLRKRVIKDAHNRCGICNASGDLECHETWNFDDISHIQKLTSLLPLCHLCHAVKHFGLSQLRSSRGEIDMEILIQHFIKINSCNRQVFNKHKTEAFLLFEERSKYQWRIDIGEAEGINYL